MFLFASELHVELIRFDGSLQYQITVDLSSVKGGRDRMVVGCTTTYAIGARCITLCDKVCLWFSPGPPVSSTNKTEILLKTVLNTIKQINNIRFVGSLKYQILRSHSTTGGIRCPP